MLYLEMLRKRIDKVNDHAHFLLGVEARLRIQAVVTCPTIILGIILAEITEQNLPAAVPRLGICHSLHKELTADFLLRYRLAHQELVQFAYVLVAVIRDTDSFLSVTACPACFLIISFQTARHVIMDDETHIGFVNAHAECYRGHYDIYILHKEAVLILGPHLGVKTGMIRKCLDTIDDKYLRKFLDLLAAQTVYDAGLAGILLDILYDILVRVHLVTHLIVEIRPVE